MIYLKADSKETLNAALNCWLKTDQEDNNYIEYYSQTHSLDIIGTIYIKSGNTMQDDKGIDYDDMIPIEGYHANLLLHGETMPDGLNEFIIEAPSSPYRRFA